MSIVRHYEIRPFRLRLLDRFSAIDCTACVEAYAGQQSFQHVQVRYLIVDDQNFLPGTRISRHHRLDGAGCGSGLLHNLQRQFEPEPASFTLPAVNFDIPTH